MTDPTTTLAPITKTVSVPVSPARAFEFYTAHIHEWWPLRTHSVGQTDAVSIVCGAGVGGEIVETTADGSAHVWGTITVWDPPGHIAHTWHAGQPREQATGIEVTFMPDGAGGTTVELVHGGWERRSGDSASVRAGYETGWDTVLGAYAARAH